MPSSPERDDDGGAVEPLLQPAGDDADHARMPAGGGDDRDGAIALRAGKALRRLRRPCASIARRSSFRRSSSAAIASASAGSSVVSRRTPRSDLPTRPPALIRGPSAKPRSRHSGARWSRAAVGERGQADIAPARHDLEPLGDEGAVEAAKLGDVGDRAERDQIEQLDQLRLLAVREEAASAQASGAKRRRAGRPCRPRRDGPARRLLRSRRAGWGSRSRSPRGASSRICDGRRRSRRRRPPWPWPAPRRPGRRNRR